MAKPPPKAISSVRRLVHSAIYFQRHSAGPELRTPGAAAQTRTVSVARIRLGSWESARAFKGIICDDVSEFESYMPSHAVGSPPAKHAGAMFCLTSTGVVRTWLVGRHAQIMAARGTRATI